MTCFQAIKTWFSPNKTWITLRQGQKSPAARRVTVGSPRVSWDRRMPEALQLMKLTV